MRPLNIFILMLVVAATSGASAQAATCPERSSWPTDKWPTNIDAVKTERAAQVAALDGYAFTREGPDASRIGVRTDSVLVVHQGQIIYERYAPHWNAERKHLSWSVSKSITSALVGIATAQAGVEVTQSICTWVQSPRPEHCEITLEQMLWMSSGLHWQEVYEGKSNQASSVLTMLYGRENENVPAFVIDHDRQRAPGTYHSYSSGETNVVMAAIQKAMKDKGADADWPWTELFDPIGMKKVTIERDQSGHFIGSSYVYTPPRDLAKFGFLYLNDGCWDGKRIVPQGWVQASLVPTPAVEREDEGDVYGYQWWLNLPNEPSTGGRPWPSLPTDAYSARGHWGQTLTIVPSMDIVFVRFADDRDDAFDYDRFAGLVLALVQ